MKTINRDHFRKIHQAIDVLILAESFISAYFVKKYVLPDPYRGVTAIPNYYIVLSFAIIVCFVVFNRIGFYETKRVKSIEQITGKVLYGVTVSFGIMILIFYLLKISDISRIMMGLYGIFSFIGLMISKSIIFYMSSIHRNRDSNKKNALIVGSTKRAQKIVSEIMNGEIDYKIFGSLEIDNNTKVGTTIGDGIEVLGTIDDFSKYLNDYPIDEVIFAMSLNEIEKIKDYLTFAESIGVDMRVLPDWEIDRIRSSLVNSKSYFHDFLGHQTLVFSSIPKDSGALFIKSLMDYSVASIVILCLAPLFILISIIIKITSSGPVFFIQERCGLGGRKIRLYKFRTMVEDAEELKSSLIEKNEVDGPVFKIKNDPRVTFIGKFLRKTSLDELPQIINILKSEMSLVGPRPPIPSEVEKYEIWQRRRLSMKPGLTCIWQVSGRNNIDFETWMKMDLDYIDNWSLWLDLKIILLTIPTVVFGKGQ